MKKQWILLLALPLAISACKKDDDVEPTTETPTTPAGPSYTAPSTYIFTDADGNSTVSYNGQEQRLEMLSEITTYMKTANTPGTSVDAMTLKDMYANVNYTWTDADMLGMTGSSKNLKSKTAASAGTADPTIQAIFENWMDELAALSATTVTGVTDGGNNQGGVVLSTTNSSKQYLQNADGFEYVQLIEKGLMGAVFHNQLSAHYLSDAELNVDNTTAVDPANGKYYTEMEHHWDEAYGYFTSAIDYPASGTDRFWGKYANSRESVLGSATKLANAFRLGRAAIANDDYTTRDAQRDIIVAEIELVAGGTGIHYLNSGMSNFADDALRNHALSEAVAFIEALRYGGNPTMTNAQIDAVLAAIGTDLYEVTIADLENARDMLANALGLEDVKEQL